MADLSVIFTQHAAEMLIERDIDRAWVELTLQNPEVVEPDPERHGVLRAFRQIPERGGRVLRVVYIPVDDTFRVITAFLIVNVR